MIKNEQEFRRLFVRIIEEAGGHVSIIESHETSIGVPDIDWCIDGFEGWSELKISIDGEAPNIRPSQRAWIRRRIKVGGFVSLLCYCCKNDNIIIVLGEYVEELKSMKDWLEYGKVVTIDEIKQVFSRKPINEH